MTSTLHTTLVNARNEIATRGLAKVRLVDESGSVCIRGGLMLGAGCEPSHDPGRPAFFPASSWRNPHYEAADDFVRDLLIERGCDPCRRPVNLDEDGWLVRWDRKRPVGPSLVRVPRPHVRTASAVLKRCYNGLMDQWTKYPRTPHLPWSRGQRTMM